LIYKPLPEPEAFLANQPAPTAEARKPLARATGRLKQV